MKEEQNLKLTDLDYLTGDNHLQMMKAALPFMNASEQKALSLFIRINELRRTINLFEDESVAAMGISPSAPKNASALDMLNTIKPFANSREQDLIDVMVNFIQGFNLSNAYRESNDSAKSPLEQLKNILPPEQQSRLENIQLMMQMFQQFA